MSTIKIEFESEDNAVVMAIGALTRSLLIVTPIGKEVEELKVVDAEEVKPAPAAKPRPSRAKAKPEPTLVEEEEVEEDEPQTETAEDADFDDEETEAIGIEDVRAKQAEKIGKHKPAIIEALKSFGATGISSLDAKHYAAYFDALSKLK